MSVVTTTTIKDNIDAEINSKLYASKYIDNDGDI